MSDTDARKVYWPIIYVRGYAMTQKEIDATTADPFCGFNLGSTVMRARPDKSQPPKKFVFESPVVRLQTEYEYRDVYEEGVDIGDPDRPDDEIPLRSIVIYRYYDEASTQFGIGETPPITDFAKGLSDLILTVRKGCGAALEKEGLAKKDFRCYLVAHSMGGLVCRAFLQNPELGSDEARRCVDKLFTYATPHNGIDMAGINVPRWLTKNDIANFNREYMRDYLNLEEIFEKTERVDFVPEAAFRSERIFCMVGTNRSDYEVAAGLSRTFVGHGSDGLVRIANASVWGVDDAGEVTAPAATAHTYRSHSGDYGIVNSEEAYQNLVRFLFGHVRVDVWFDIEDVRVPEDLEAKDAEGKVDALYQIELHTAPRGARWYLTRRVSEEDSVACRSHKQLRASEGGVEPVYLTTVFLSERYRVERAPSSLAYGLSLGVRVPDYEVEKRFWPDRHYEGQYLFRDALALEMTPPAGDGDDWKVTYDWQSDEVGQASKPVPKQTLNEGRVEITIPVVSSGATPPRSPGITGKLRFVVSRWNTW